MLSYNTHREWVAKALGYAGVRSRQKTHITRSSAAKLAELKGADDGQIRRAGHWNLETMMGCYLNSLPRKFMRLMAGHLAELGLFEVRRGRVMPLDSLLLMI